ncbi:MAG TPA: division/cell wall cluster transcriptional repressor MraZ [Pseudomonadales bacterium]
MFRGVNNVSLDAKGRMALPTRYRDLVEERCAGQLIVTIDTEERCLLIYPIQDWEALEKDLARLPSFNKAARRVQRLLVGHATDVELDMNGRLLVPPPLRQFASLDKKAVLIGQGRKFELWSEETWQVRRDQWLEEDVLDGGDLPDDLMSISL